MQTVFQIIEILQWLAIASLTVGVVYVIAQKPSLLQMETLVLLLAADVMMIGSLMEITASDLDAAMTGTAVSYLGKPFVPVFTTLFIATYCGYRLSPHLLRIVCGICALIPTLVFTNEYHHLYYTVTEYVDDADMLSPLVMTPGPLYYLFAAIILVSFILETCMAVREFFRTSDRSERAPVGCIFGMIICAAAGYALYLSGVTHGYDSTMAGCFFATIFLLLLFFRFRVLDMVTLAKEQALNDTSAGVLVTDRHSRILYANNSVNRLMQDKDTMLAIRGMESEGTVKYQGRVYRVEKRGVSVRGKSQGTVIEIGDITDTYTYAERLERDVLSRTMEIRHIQRTLVGGIANIVEARDGETGSHVKRTAAIVELLAQKLRELGYYTDELGDDSIRRMVEAAPLHDIGKIAVSDTILLKPGRLTPEEFEEMKKHAAAGVDVIEKVMRGVENNSYVSVAEDMAHYHHEKWDGSGYPAGLSGEDIPLSARIMAVADVYDALRSDRCYKKAMDAASAKEIILEGSGKHFDPAVVTAFTACYDAIEGVL